MKSSTFGLALGLAKSLQKFTLPVGAAYDLDNDVAPLDTLPTWFQQRTAEPERTNALPAAYYAVHVWPVGRPAGLNEMLDQVNGWFSASLCGRRARFIVHDDLSPEERAGDVERLFELGRANPDFGTRQQLHIYLAAAVPSLALAAPHVVLLGLPADAENLDKPTLAAVLAHLLGHALGLGHPRLDIDTEGTPWASQFSFMHPSLMDRGLPGSLLLDSPLNPDKGRLARSGFFPYKGVIYTKQDGAVPLEPGARIEGQGQAVLIAHGNYRLPAQPGRSAVTVVGSDLVVDLGSALVAGDASEYAEFGYHEAYGTGIHLAGAAGDKVTLRGGIITGYSYGVKADHLDECTIEGVTVVDNRRFQSDARRAGDDPLRGGWLDFWLTPEEDATEAWFGSLETEDLGGTMGAGIRLDACRGTTCREVLATHNTVGIADYYGRSNCYEASDLSGCAIGLRFWDARGSLERPILVTGNRMHFNTQPERWWWSQGDSAAITSAGLQHCVIRGNDIAFGGNGLFLGGFPRLPAQTIGIRVEDNDIGHCYAHGVESDFGQDCVLQDNRIGYNWLSGVWAGHTGGILITGNEFVRNNRGRLFGGWSDSQGAISCPQGRAVIAGNTFEDNWVAINLRKAVVPTWWLFAGEAAGHVVAGNAFRSNRVAIRLQGVTASSLTANLMQGNNEDIAGDPADNEIRDNGPQADTTRFEAVFFPVHTLLLDDFHLDAAFRLLSLDGRGGSVLPPDEVVVKNGGGWLQASTRSDGVINITAHRIEAGMWAAAVDVRAAGRRWRVPVKLLTGDFLVTVRRDEGEPMPEDPARGSPALIDNTPVGPAAILGWCGPLSNILRTKSATNVIGAEPFRCDFTRRVFMGPAGGGNVFAMVLSDGVTSLSLTGEGPGFTPKEPKIDPGWLWAAENLNLSRAADRFVLNYKHLADAAACVVLWLYPLDEEDLARQPSASAAAARTNYLLTMPGERRRLRVPAVFLPLLSR